MAYRIKCAETPEERAKEERFMGLGLTSRKNLCIHPDVRPYFHNEIACPTATADAFFATRFPRKRRER
jgi:hypothetical protein